MTLTHTQKDIDDLEALLDAERAALLKGDLVALTEMLAQKEALIGSLKTQSNSDLPVLQRLDTKLRRNQLLLNGALEGIREVAGRLATLRRMRGGLETYSSDGTRKHIEVEVDHTVEKRA